MNINERQDLEKIEDINSIIAEIHNKLNSKDYQVGRLSEFTKPVKYIIVSLPDLNIYLTPIRTGVEGHFGRKDYKDFRAPYILLHNSKFKRNIEFDEDAMAHELQHYNDWKAGNQFTDFKNILKPEGGINPEYYNDPTEWSAYVIQILRQYFQKVPLKKLQEDFQSFYKDFWRKTEAQDLYKNLNEDNKKKFQKYLWQFHQKLLEKKHEVNEIIREEMQKFIYSIPDLAKILERQGFDAEGQKILEDILLDAYRQNGDEGVIEKYGEMAGVEIQAISRGRYVFDTLVGGGEPMLEAVNERQDVEKIGEVNELRQEIDKLLETGQYDSWKPYGDHITVQVSIPRNGHVLKVNFSNSDKRYQSLGNFDDNGGKPMVIIRRAKIQIGLINA